jgi:hypothetical protein
MGYLGNQGAERKLTASPVRKRYVAETAKECNLPSDGLQETVLRATLPFCY